MRAASALVLVAMIACAEEREYVDPPLPDVLPADPALSALLSHGEVAGDFWERRHFDGPSSLLSGFNDPSGPSAAVMVAREEGAKGAGMIILSTHGWSLGDLPLGQHRFPQADVASTEPSVTAAVCAGPDVFSIEKDAPADEVEIDVSDESDGTRLVNVRTTTALRDPLTGALLGQVDVAQGGFRYRSLER